MFSTASPGALTPVTCALWEPDPYKGQVLIVNLVTPCHPHGVCLDFCGHGSDLLEVILEGPGSALPVPPSAPAAGLLHLDDLLYLSWCTVRSPGASSTLLMLCWRTLEAFWPWHIWMCHPGGAVSLQNFCSLQLQPHLEKQTNKKKLRIREKNCFVMETILLFLWKSLSAGIFCWCLLNTSLTLYWSTNLSHTREPSKDLKFCFI